MPTSWIRRRALARCGGWTLRGVSPPAHRSHRRRRDRRHRLDPVSAAGDAGAFRCRCAASCRARARSPGDGTPRRRVRWRGYGTAGDRTGRGRCLCTDQPDRFTERVPALPVVHVTARDAPAETSWMRALADETPAVSRPSAMAFDLPRLEESSVVSEPERAQGLASVPGFSQRRWWAPPAEAEPRPAADVRVQQHAADPGVASVDPYGPATVPAEHIRSERQDVLPPAADVLCARALAPPAPPPLRAGPPRTGFPATSGRRKTCG